MLNVDLPGVSASIALPTGIVVEVSQTDGINLEIDGQDGSRIGLECEIGAPPTFEHRPGDPQAPFLRLSRTADQDGYLIEVATASEDGLWVEVTTLLDSELKSLVLP